MTVNGPTPNAAMATNLFNFLATHANQSWTNLTSQALGESQRDTATAALASCKQALENYTKQVYLLL